MSKDPDAGAGARWPDGTPRSTCNAFSTSMGLSWAAEQTALKVRRARSSNLEQRRALGLSDPGTLYGISQKADEHIRQRKQELARRKGGASS